MATHRLRIRAEIVSLGTPVAGLDYGTPDWKVPFAEAEFEFTDRKDLHAFIEQFGKVMGARK